MCVCVCWEASSGLAKQNNWLETCCKLFFPYDLDRSGQGNHLESQETIQAWGNKNTSRKRLQRPQGGSRVETQPTGSSRTCLWFTAKNREAKCHSRFREAMPRNILVPPLGRKTGKIRLEARWLIEPLLWSKWEMVVYISEISRN